MSSGLQSEALLVFRAGARLCALPVLHIAEVLRPLPLFAAPDAPNYVMGAAMHRGAPCPVIDLGLLVNDQSVSADAKRLIAVKVGAHRRVGLLVSDVLGVRTNVNRSLNSAPLIENCPSELVGELAKLDGELLTVLRLGTVVPEETWAALEGGQP